MPQIHLWTLNIPDSLTQDQQTPLYLLLSQPEQERYNEMGSEERKKEYLLSHVLARVKISEVLNLKPQDLPLEFENNKKPILKMTNKSAVVPASSEDQGREPKSGFPPKVFTRGGNDNPPQLSIAHTKALACVAFAPCPIGVDVELRRGRPQNPNVAKRYFSKEEIDEMNSLPEDQRNDRHYQLWTLKESFYKASEFSVSEMVDWTNFKIEQDGTVSFTLRPEARGQRPEVRSPITDNRTTSHWHFKLKSTPHHILALSYQSENELEIKEEEIKVADLIHHQTE